MINLRAGFADKLNCNYSIFITFAYNPNYVTLIKTLKTRAWNNDKKWWEIPYSDYTPLISMLNQYQIPYNAQEFMESIKILSSEVEKMQTIQNQDANVDVTILDEVEFKTKPFEYQKEGIAYGLTVDKYLNADDQGLGKALALETPILTNKGWKHIKNIHIGEILFDEKGNTCQVTNIFDHQNKNMYRITFSDNTNVVCCDEHLWTVYTVSSRRRKNKYRTLPLKDILNDIKIGNNYKYYIPMCDPVKFEKKILPIHPYILGALIGDGCLLHQISFSTADDFMVQKINALLKQDNYILRPCKSKLYNYTLTKNVPYRTHYINKFKTALKELGLMDKNSHNKFIPSIYKFSTVEDRIQLLQGLMDTDGYIAKNGTIQYTSCCEQLCNDVGELIESLGGTYLKSYKRIKEKFEAWTLTIKLNPNIQPVTLPRKVERLNLKRIYKPIRLIKKIEYVGKQPARCITVNSPNNLFLINNFIVTHNTYQTLNTAILKRGGKHCLIICGYKSLLFNWAKEVEKHTNEKAYVIGQRLGKRTKKLKVGKLPERMEDIQTLDKREEFFLITDINTLRQCIKEEYIKKNGKKGTNKTYPFADALEEWCRKGEIGRIIYDEFQTCKNFETDQTQSLLRLRSCPLKIAATGTPIMNRNIDLYPLMVWLGYETRNFWEFRERYCKLGGFKGKQIIGNKNNQELNARLSKFMIRRKKEDVLDLPEKIIIDEYLELDGKQWSLYEKTQKLARAQLSQMKGNKVALMASMLSMRKITSYPQWVDENISESVKFERILQIVNEAFENNRKTIVFSNWSTPIYALEKLLQHYNPAIITGDTKDRMEQVEKFQNDTNCHVILGTIGAMGTGLTLTAASNVIFLDEPWNRALKDQATDRAYRIGTKYSVNVYTLICKDTVDEGVHKTVFKKGRLADEIVDGVSPDELINIIENY